MDDGNADVPFELDSNIIRVKEPGKLDYETDSVFTFHVVVTDQDGLSDTATITVNLNDTPEPPKFDDKTPTFAVDENVPAGTFVGVLQGYIGNYASHKGYNVSKGQYCLSP